MCCTFQYFNFKHLFRNTLNLYVFNIDNRRMNNQETILLAIDEYNRQPTHDKLKGLLQNLFQPTTHFIVGFQICRVISSFKIFTKYMTFLKEHYSGAFKDSVFATDTLFNQTLASSIVISPKEIITYLFDSNVIGPRHLARVVANIKNINLQQEDMDLLWQHVINKPNQQSVLISLIVLMSKRRYLTAQHLEQAWNILNQEQRMNLVYDMLDELGRIQHNDELTKTYVEKLRQTPIYQQMYDWFLPRHQERRRNGRSQDVHTLDPYRISLLDWLVQKVPTCDYLVARQVMSELECHPRMSPKAEHAIQEIMTYTTNFSTSSGANIDMQTILFSILIYVSNTQSQHKEEVFARLIEELEEMHTTCLSGHINRLFNCLHGFFDYESITEKHVEIFVSETFELKLKELAQNNSRLYEDVIDQITDDAFMPITREWIQKTLQDVFMACCHQPKFVGRFTKKQMAIMVQQQGEKYFNFKEAKPLYDDQRRTAIVNG